MKSKSVKENRPFAFDKQAAKSPLDLPVSVYRCSNSKKPLPPMTVNEVLDECQKMKVTDAIKKLRVLKAKNGSPAAAIHKLKQNSLKAFCIMGQFTEEGHRKEFFIPESYTGIIPVDLDDPEDREKTIRELNESPHCWTAGRSPAGKGVKAFFQAPPIFEQHDDNVAAVAKEVKRRTGYDMELPEINRLTFFFPDPSLRVNRNGVTPIKVTPREKKPSTPREETSSPTETTAAETKAQKLCSPLVGKIGAFRTDTADKRKRRYAVIRCPCFLRQHHDEIKDTRLYLNPESYPKIECRHGKCREFNEVINEKIREKYDLSNIFHEQFDIEKLFTFDLENDPNRLLGTGRWLSKGSTCLVAGYSGGGKSTLTIQAAVYWALGLGLFGIRPVRPLRSLLIQAEDDEGDTAEMVQGVLGALGKSPVDLEGRVVIERVSGAVGPKFCKFLRQLIEQHKPDLVWINPLFAFAGCNLMDPKEAGVFLRRDLIPVAVETETCFFVIHHLRKPDRDGNKGNQLLPESLLQYLAIGGSEIQNAFREVMILMEETNKTNDGTRLFELILTKRGKRAGALSLDLQLTTKLFLTHSTDGRLNWIQVDKPFDDEKGSKNTKYTDEDVLGVMNTDEGLTTSNVRKKVQDTTGMSRAVFFRTWKVLKTQSLIREIKDDLWVRTPEQEIPL